MSYDIVIRGGEVIDPSQGLRKVCDVAVAGDRIAAVEESIDATGVHQVIDARGQLVVPLSLIHI